MYDAKLKTGSSTQPVHTQNPDLAKRDPPPSSRNVAHDPFLVSHDIQRHLAIYYPQILRHSQQRANETQRKQYQKRVCGNNHSAPPCTSNLALFETTSAV